MENIIGRAPDQIRKEVQAPFYAAMEKFQEHCQSPEVSVDSIKSGYADLERITAEELGRGFRPDDLFVRYSMLTLNAGTAQRTAKMLGDEELANEFGNRIEELKEAIFGAFNPLDRMKNEMGERRIQNKPLFSPNL